MTDDGVSELQEIVLRNTRGDTVRLLNFGARILSICIETATGPRELVLGYSHPEDYLTDPFFMGASIGRFANRIGGAQFEIDGQGFRLEANEGTNQLHGGPFGFDKQYWISCDSVSTSSVSYTLRSEDGDQGFPGNVSARIGFHWNDNRQLQIRYSATTDKKTHINLTSHPYFNLDGDGESILDHMILVNSERITETDNQSIPTGQFRDLNGGTLDLRRGKIVREIIEAPSAVTGTRQGVDSNFELSGNGVAAELWSSNRDLKMSISTTFPGMQLYTGQYLDSPFKPFCGLCLEPQYFPDSPNQPDFTGTLLRPDERFDEVTTMTFEECG